VLTSLLLWSYIIWEPKYNIYGYGQSVQMMSEKNTVYGFFQQTYAWFIIKINRVNKK